MTLECENCGAPNPDAARRCPGCGTRVDPTRALSALRDAVAVARREDRPGLLLTLASWTAEAGDLDGAYLLLAREFEATRDDAAYGEALGSFAQQADRWDALLWMYETLAASLGPTPGAFALRLRLARWYASREDPLDRTGAHLAAAAAIDPNHPEVLSFQASRASEAGDAALELSALERLATLSKAPGTRQVALRALIDAHRRAGRPEQALDAWRQLQLADPSDPETFAGLLEAYEQAERWADLVDALEARLAVPGVADDVRESRALRARIAQLRTERLADPQGAAAEYRRALRAHPGDPEILEALAAIEERLGRWDDAAETLRELTDALGDDPDKMAALERLAVAWANLGDPVAEADCYREMATLDPTAPGALAGLRRLYRQAREWEALVAVLERIAEGADPAERDALTVEVAELEAGPLDRPREAQARLRPLAARDDAPLNALELLADLCDALEAYDEEAVLLERVAAQSEDPAPIRLRLAELQASRLDDPSAAFEQVVAAFRERPADQELEARLVALARLAGRRDELARLFAELARSAPAPLRRHFTHARARIAEAASEEEKAWREALAIDAGDREALAALDALLEREERWRQLAEVLERRVVAEPEAAEAHLWRLAGLYEGALRASRVAVERYHRLLALCPGHAGALSRLAAIHGQREEWLPLFHVYERQAEVADPETRRELLGRMADLAEVHLDHPHDSVRFWEQLLTEDPTDPEPYANLARLFAAEESWAALADILERRLDVEAGEPRRRTWQELAEVWEDRLEAPERALDVLLSAFSSTLDDGSYGAEIGRLAAGLPGSYERAVAAYAAALERERTPRHVELALHLRIAGWREAMGEPEAAEGSLRAALDLSPEHAGALALLEAFLMRHERWAEAVEVVERQAALAPRGARHGYLAAAGELKEKLGDLDGAAQAWRAVRDALPEDASALAALARIYEAQGDEERLADVLAAAPPPEADALPHHLRLGGLLHGREPGRAAEAYREALTLDPGCVEALDALISLYRQLGDPLHLAQVMERRLELREPPLADAGALRVELADLYFGPLAAPESASEVLEAAFAEDPDNVTVLRALGALAAERGEWVRAVEMLGREADALPHGEERLAAERRAARVFEDHLADAGAAFEWAARAFVSAPEDPANVAELERLAEVTGRTRDVLLAYREAARAAADPEVRRRVVRTLARRALDAGLLEDAERAWRDLLVSTPDDPAALEALDGVLGSLGRPGEQAAVVGRRAELAAPEDRPPLLVRLGQLHETLADAAAAARAYIAALELEAYEPTALSRLAVLYEADEAWSHLYEVQRRSLVHADPEGAVPVRAKLAHLAERHLGMLDEAVELWTQVHLADPRHPEAEDALLRLYERTEAWIPLAERLRTRIDEGRGDAVDFDQLATLLEAQLHDPVGALEVRCAELRVRHDDALSGELERLAELTDDWEQPAAAYEAAIAEAPSLPLHARVAGWYDLHLGQVEDAIRHYRAVLTLDPSRWDAEEALISLLEGDEHWSDLVTLLESRADRVDPETRRQLLAHIAGLSADHLDDPDRAVSAWLRVLRDDLADLDAWRSLGPLYERLERWLDLFEVHRELSQRVEDQDVAVGHLLTAAQLARTRLEDPELAAEAWGAALELDPHCQEALDGLGHHLEQRERWGEVAALHERRLRAGLPPERDLEVRRVVLALCRGPLNDPKRAIGALLPLLTEDAEDWLLETLAELYAERGDWLRCVDVTSRLAYQVEGREAQLVLRRRVGSLYDEKLHDSAHAFDWVLSAWNEVPDDDELLGWARRLAEDSGRLAELAVSMERAWDRVVELVEHGHALASLLRDDLGDAAGAERVLRRLLELDPTNERAVLDLAELLGSEGRWAEHAEALEAWAFVARGEGGAPELLLRAAEVRAGRLDDQEGAAELCRQVLEAAPDHEQAFQMLCALYRSAEAWDGLLELLRWRAEDAGEDRARWLAEVASVVEQSGDVEAAIDAWGAVLNLDPGGDAEVRLEALLASNRRWHQLVELLEARLGRTDDPGAREVTYARLASVLEADLGDLDRALEVWCAAFAEAPDDALGPELERLARQTHAWVAVTGVYEEALRELTEAGAGGEATTVAADAAAAMRLRLATWYADLGEVKGAQHHFEAILEHEPTHAGALAALTAVVEAHGTLEEVAALFDRRATLADSQARRRAELVRLAWLCTNRLEAPARAVEAWHSVLADHPDDGEAWRALPPLFERLERWEELADTVERLVELGVRDPATQLERAANVRLLHLGDPDGASRLYQAALDTSPPEEQATRLQVGLARALGERDPEGAEAALNQVLLVDPDHTEALEGLVALREAAGGLAEAVALQRRLVDNAATAAQRAERLRHLARLHARGEDGGAALALDDCLTAMRLAPEDAGLAAETRTYGERSGRLADYAAALHRANAATHDPALAHARHRELGGLWTALERWPEAEAAWRLALDVGAGDLEALEGLEAALAALGREAERLEVLGRRAELVGDPALYVSLGEGWEAAGDLLGAVQAYDAAGEEGHPRLLALHERTGDWEALDGVLARLDQTPETLARRARLAAGPRACPGEAGDLWGLVLEARAGDQEALEGRADAYDAEERWEELQAFLREQLDRAEAPTLRRPLHLRLARATRSAREGLEILLDAYAEAPDAGLAEELARFAEEANAWPRLESALEAQADELDPADAAESRLRLAAWAAGRGAGDAARARCAAILEAAPGHPGALQLLTTLAERSGDPDELAEVLEARLAAGEDAPDLHLRLAELAERRGDLARAAAAWERVVAADAEDPAPRHALLRLYERLEDWPRLGKTLEALAERESSLAHLEHAASVWHGRVGDPERAASVLREALSTAEEPADRRRIALRLAEVVEAEADAVAALRPLVAEGIADGAVLVRLADHAHEAGDDEAEREALEAQVELAPTAAAWRRLADLRAGEPGAVEAALEALQYDPADDALLDFARSLAEASSRLPELAAALEGVLESARDPALLSARGATLGALYTELDDPEGAEGAWEAVLTQSPEDHPALAGLQAALEAQGRAAEAADVLLRRASLGHDPALYLAYGERMEQEGELVAAAGALDAALEAAPDDPALVARRARLAVGLGDNEGAAGRWRRVLELTPGNPAAATGLESALTLLERWDELTDHLRARLETAEGLDARLALLRQIAAATPDPSARLDVLLEIFGESGDPVLAVDVGPLAEQTRRWDEVIEAFTAVAVGATGPQGLALHLHLAGWHQKLGKAGPAEKHYEAALAIEPKHPAALDGLTSLMQTTGDFLRVADVLERTASLTDDEQARRATRVRLAYLATGRLNDAERGAKAWEALHAEDPTDPQPLRALPPLYEQLERWPELADALEAQAKIEPEGVRHEVLVRVAEIALEQLADPHRARHAFEAALAAAPPPEVAAHIELRLSELLAETAPEAALDAARRVLATWPDQPEALATVARLAERSGHFEEAAEALHALAREAPDPKTRSLRLRDLAALQEGPQEDAEGAFETWLSVLRADPAEAATLPDLHRLAAQLDAGDRLRAALEALGEGAPDPQTEAALATALARLAERSGDAEAAETEWSRVLFLREDDPEALAGLQAAAEGRGDAAAAKALLLRRARRTGEAELWRRLAGDTTQPEDAAEAWRAVLADAPGDEQAQAGLEAALERLERWDELAAALRSRLERSDSAEERRAVHQRIAAVESDPASALQALLAAFLEDPDDAALGDDIGIRAAEAGDWERVTALYERAAEDAGPAGLPLWLRLASWYEGPLGDARAAALTYSRARLVAPDDPRLLEALERSYERAEDWAGLVELLESGPPTPEALARAARIHERRLGDDAAAARAWLQVVELAPEDSEAIEGAGRLLAAGGDGGALLEFVAAHPSAPAVAHLAAGRAAEAAGDEERALAEWRRADTAEARAAIDALCRRAERWSDLAELYEGRDDLPSQEALADLYAGPLARPDEAARLLDRLLDQRPDDDHRRRTRIELAVAAEDWLAAAYHLAERARRRDDPALWTRLAEIREQQLEDLGGAFEAHAAALARVPSSQPSLRAVTRLGTGREAELAALLSEILPAVEDPERRAAVSKALGEASAGIEDPGAAEAALRLVLERDPTDSGAAGSLATLLRSQERFSDAAAVLEGVGDLAGAEAAWARSDAPEAPAERVRLLVALERWAELAELLRTNPALGESTVREAAWRRTESWTELVDLLEERATPESEGELVDLYRGPLRDPAAAARVLLRRLERNPGDPDALGTMAEVAEAAEDWGTAADALGRLAELTEDPAERAELRVRAAEVCGVHLGEAQLAFDLLALALREGPAPAAHREAAVVAAEVAGRHGDLAEVFKAVIQNVRDVEVIRAVRHELAELYHRHLGDPASAERTWKAILEADPQHRGALAGMARLLEDGGRWMELVLVLQRQLDGARDPELRRDLRLRLGDAYATHLDQPEAALAQYQLVLDAAPGDARALEAIAAVHERQGDWRPAYDALSRLAEVGPGSPGTIETRLARIAERMERSDQALVHYLEALAGAPDDTEAQEALDRLLVASEDRPAAIELLERQIRATQDKAHKIALLKRVVRLREASGHEAAAFDAWQRIRDLAPQDTDALHALAGHFAVTGGWEDLIGAHEALADAEPERAADHLLAAVGVAEEHVPDRITDLLETAAFQGAQVGDALARQYRAEARWNELVALFEARLSEEDDPGLRAEVARIYAGPLDDPARALEILKDAFDPDAPDPDLLRQLREFAERAGDVTALVNLLSREAYLAATEIEQADRRRRVAELYRDELGEPGMAFDWFGSVLSVIPSDEEAASALVELAIRSGREKDAVVHLWGASNSAPDDDTRRRLGLQMARLYHGSLEDPERALAMYEYVLDLSPDDPAVLEELAEAFEGMERWESAATALERLVEWVDDPDLRMRLARLLEARLGRPERAREQLVEVLAARPNDREALGRLESIHAFQQDWDGLHDLLARHVSTLGDAAPADLLKRLAALAAQTGKPDAAERWAAVLEATPEDEEAHAAVAAAYEAAGRWRDLAMLLLERLGDVAEATERTPGYLRVAEVLETRCADHQGALAALVQAFAADPDDALLGDEIERLARLTDGFEAAARAYEAACVAQDEAANAPLHARLARWYREQLNIPDKASEHAARMLALSEAELGGDEREQLLEDAGRWAELAEELERRPVDPPTLVRLARVRYEHLDDADGAAEAAERALALDPRASAALRLLERVYRGSERWQELADLYERQLRMVSDGHAQVHLRTALAELYRGPLGDLRKAVDTLTPLPQTAGQTMNTLLELHIKLQDWNQVVGMLQEQAAQLPSGSKRRDKHLMVARILRDELGRPGEAVEWFARAWALRPEEGELLDELREAARAGARLDALVQAYWDGLKNTRNGRLIRSLSLEMADIYRDELDDPGAAEGLYHYVLQAIDAADPEALAGLERVLEKQDKWGELAALLEQRIAAEPQHRIALEARLAEVRAKA